MSHGMKTWLRLCIVTDKSCDLEFQQVFGGFTPVSKVPFDHERPPATIKATVKLVHDKNPKGYAKGVNDCHSTR